MPDRADCRPRTDGAQLPPQAAYRSLDGGRPAGMHGAEGAQQQLVARHRPATAAEQAEEHLRLRERQRRLLFAVPQRLPRHVVDDIAGDDALQFRGCMCALPHAPYSTKWK